MPWIQSLALFVVALALRLTSLSAYGGGRYFGKYVNGAAALGRGELEPQRVLDFSPLYLELHRLFQLAGLSPMAVKALQCGVGAASCVLVAWIAAKWLGVGWGWVAGLLMALHRDAIVYDALLEPEPFFVFFVLLAFWSAASEESDDRVAWPRASIAAVATGLAIATRPSAWVFVPLVGLLMLFGPRGHWRSRALPRAAVFALALGLCLVGADLRAASLGEGASMSPWQVFYTGNNPLATGGWREDFLIKELELQQPTDRMDRAHEVFREVALAAGASADAPDRYWLSLSLRYLREYPLAATRLLAHKLVALGQPTASFDFPLAREMVGSLASWPLWTPSLAFVFGLAGFVWRRGPGPVAAMCAAAAVVPLVFFVSSRYRLPMAPWLNVGAAAFLALLVERVRAAERARVAAVALPVASVALGLMLVFAPLAPGHLAARKQQAIRELLPAREEAARLRSADRLVQAGERLRDAVYPLPWRIDRLREVRVPFDLEKSAAHHLDRAGREARRDGTPWSWLRSAVLLDQAGASAQALDAYREVVASGFWPGDRPLAVRAHVRAGKLLARLGRRDEARRSFARASELAPGAPVPLVGLALTAERGQARRLLDQALRVNCVFEVQYAHGRMALDLGRPDEALEPLSALADGLPHFVRGRLLLATALHRTGNADLALLHTMRAHAERSPLIDPVYDGVEIVADAAARRPEDPEAWQRLTRFAAFHGEYPLALQAWQHIEEAFGLSAEDLALAGRLSLMHEDTERAIALLDQAHEAMPDRRDVAAWLSLARARAAADRADDPQPPGAQG